MPSAPWLAATALKQKAVVYIVRFDGIGGQYSTGPVKNASMGTNLWLSPPSGLSQSIDPVTGRYTVGAVSFTLADRAQNVTILLATEHSSPIVSTILNRGVTILSGYSDIDEADYQTVYRGFVTDIALGSDFASYDFSCGTPNRKTVEDIFANADAGGGRVDTVLVGTHSAGVSKLSVASVANILPDDYLFVGKNGSGEEERVQIAIVGNQSVVTKAPTTYTYPSGTAVRWAATRIRGNPINIWYSLLTGTFSTGGSFPLVSFDGVPTGLGVDPADIDTTALAAERDDFMWGLELSFEVTQRERAKDFFEKQIFRMFGFPVTTLEGKLSFRCFRPARPTEVLTLTHTDVVSVSQWKRAFEHSYNRILFRHSYDTERSAFLQEKVVEDTVDQAATGIRELVIEHRGLFIQNTGLNRIAMEDYGARFLRRFMKGAPTLKVLTHLTKRAFTLGDCVEFTHFALPDVRGGRGIAYGPARPKYQIIAIEHLDNEGLVSLLIQEDGFIRPMWICPNGQNDFGTATTDHKRRWYISPTSGANFADGTPPYLVM